MAGGPSAVDVDVARLGGSTVLAVNGAALRGDLPAAAVFSLDHRWIRKHRGFLERFAGEKYLALPLETWPDCGGISGATYLRWSHEGGLSEDPSVVRTGGNSGYAAINLCVLKGAKTIRLVGYDMDPRDGDKYRQWIPRFRTMLPQLERLGVSVVNCNPRSFVDAFPFEEV